MRKGQIALYVIIAILLVGSVAIFIYYRNTVVQQQIGSEQATIQSVASQLQPVEKYFLDCLKQKAQESADIAGQQGGYVELPADDPGSTYMPFSNKLSFLGISVPYWWYISGNNIVKSNVPAIKDIQSGMEKYIEKNIDDCDLNSFFPQGYDISVGNETNANVAISDEFIDFEIDKKVVISMADSTGTVEKHKFRLPIKLGKMYAAATSIFEAEQNNLFLENYTVDLLGLYAPYTGFEISCAPKFWSKLQVKSTVQDAISGNIGAIKLNGKYYTLAKSENIYFIQNIKNLQTDEGMDVNFVYNKAWPMKFEVYPSDNDIMRADPVGMQEGISVLGFCVVPYHFVYDTAFPTLVQIYDTSDNYVFQFPVVVSVFRNKPRTAELSYSVSTVNDLCTNKIQETVVNVQDVSGNPVEADISFKCINDICDIGTAQLSENGATLDANFPQCINGFIIAEKDGYAPSKQQVSTNQFGIIDMIMYPLHELNVDIKEKGKVVLFASNDKGYSTTITWPDQKTIKLSEGNYQIKAWLLQNGTFSLAATQQQQCVRVPEAGLPGLLGVQTDQCFNIDIPAVTVNELPAGGATLNWSVSDSELKDASKITFNLNSWAVPKNQNEIIDAYSKIENEPVAQPVLS